VIEAVPTSRCVIWVLLVNVTTTVCETVPQGVRNLRRLGLAVMGLGSTPGFAAVKNPAIVPI
jgi:hypothetical protein